MISLSDEQQLLVRTVRDLAKNEFAERAFEWDGIPWKNFRTLADKGLFGVNFGEEYGGGGMTEYEVLLMNEAIGRICPDTGRLLNTMHLVAPRTIDMFGSEAAKDKYLPGVVNAEYYIAIAISEPEAGSDVKSMNTNIKEGKSGGLTINGEKAWVSNVGDAKAGVIWTKFPDGKLGTVIIDFDDPGVEIANEYVNMAGHKQTHFFMEDVHVPQENVLVRGEDAFREQLNALNWERLGAAFSANTIAINALIQALEYAQERKQFGQTIDNFQGIEWKLADMVKQVEASRAITHRTAKSAVEQGRVPDPMQTHIAKLYASEMAERVVSEALQIHGANGYQKGHSLEYLYRLQRGYRIAGGTDEIQKNTIANMLKENGVPELV